MTTSTKNAGAVNPTLVGQTVALSLLGVAPENARFNEPADADIPGLADSIFAAGILINLLVRKGTGKKENAWMALDGRRRLLALNHLLEAGKIGSDYQVKIEVMEGDEAIAAAVIVANTQRRSPHIADTLSAIRAMRERKMSIDKIAKSLCMNPNDVRKYELMAMAPKEALDALRANKINMSMLKLISRVPDKGEQKRLAQQAMTGYLGEYTVKSLIDNKGYSSEAPVIKIIGLDTYEAEKGAVQKDMFGEYAPRCLDEALVQELWRQKVTPLAAILEQKGLSVLYHTETDPDAPEGLSEAPNINRSDEYRAQSETLLGAINDQVEVIKARDTAVPMDANLFFDMMEAEYNMAVHEFEGLPLTAVCIHPSDGDSLITTTFYTTEDAYNEFFDARRANAVGSTTANATNWSPFITKRDELPARDVTVDVSQQSHAYHMLATNIASRGLQRSIATDYRVSLLLVTSQMFSQTLLNDGNHGECTRLFQGSFAARVKEDTVTVPGLDDGIVAKLLAYRTAFLESGLTTIKYVEGLDFDQFQDLFAHLTAINSEIKEIRTDFLRPMARADAQEVSAYLAHDIRAYYAPDVELFIKCSKGQLLRYAEQMGLEDETLPAMKKKDLANHIAINAQERNWVPDSLSFENVDIDAGDEGGELSSDESGEAADVNGIASTGEDDEDDDLEEPLED